MRIFSEITTLFIIFVICTILNASCSSDNSTDNSETEEISLRQAENIVFVQILNSNDSGKVVYELPTKIKSGDGIRAKGGDSTYINQCDSWFFFINDHPELRYVHPCRYSFIACSDGKYIVINERNEPENMDSLKIVVF